VTLRSTTDGDTARFYVGDTNVAVRFLGINTPESTGKIQPWGRAASDFTKEKLLTAERIILINDQDVFGVTDSSGNRYLGFVWYKPVDSQYFRLLNLELVELAYTENLMFERSSICDYYDAFQRAGTHASATGARIYGQDDPTFDYSGQVYDISIRFAREAFNQTVPLEDRNGEPVLDENEDPVMITLSESTRIRIRAVVLGSIGNNMVIRDVYNPDINGNYASVFMFTQYRDAPFQEPGDIVEFYCKVTTFNDNVQFTDPELTTYSQKYPYIRITHPDAEDYQDVLETNGIELEAATAEPLDFTELSVTSSESFAPFNGFYVTANVTIREVTNDGDDGGSGYTTGDYWRKDANNNMTIYAYFYDTTVSFNLRIDGGMFPYVNYDWFELDHSYTVSGYIAPFYENYQLQLLNGVAITELVG
jgi:endonuclease YncB( thermonuclease family)